MNVRLPLTLLLALTTAQLPAQMIAPRQVEGRLHGFFTIHSLNSKQIGYGELQQFAHGGRVTSRLTSRFGDGSLDDESTVFSEGKTFTLISDRHIQRGPLFPHQLNLSTDAAGKTTNRTLDSSGKLKLEVSNVELPPNTAVNAMMGTLMANLDPAVKSLRIPVLTPTQKPRPVHLVITPEGRGTFRIAGSRQTAAIFRLKTELGGIAGVIAPVIDKQPEDIIVWILEGNSPTMIRAIGQFSEGGPLMDIQAAGATFARAPIR